jgi:large repetitive protein
MSKRRGSYGLFLVLGFAAVASAGATCDNNSLTITPDTLPNSAVDSNYSAALSANGSTDGLWRVSSGGFPPGLSLDGDSGRITGRATAAGVFQFTIEVTRLFAGSGNQSYTVTINPKLALEFSLSIARQDEAYSETVDATGGVPPYTYDFVGLPAGLSGDADTGEISGTPVEPENGRSIQVTVSDSGTPPQTADDTASLLIKPRAVSIITDAALDPGRVNFSYSDEVTVTDGDPPYTFAITDGVLPPGLSLPDDQDNGVIAGIPEEAGVFTFTLTVTDDDNPASSDSQEFTITIAPP